MLHESNRKGEMNAMKTLFLVCFVPLLCLGLSAPLRADSEQSGCGLGSGYLERDALLKDTVNIYDETGRRIGTLKQDYLLKDRTYIYDETGNRRGFMEKDFLFKDRTNIYMDEPD